MTESSHQFPSISGPDSPRDIVPILETVKLCKSFFAGGLRGKPIQILNSVDMKVQAGDIRGIAGESGSGKTTLARCGLWLSKPSSGLVRFDGTDLSSLNPGALRARRREFQMIFQDPFASLNPSMTVGEILSEPFQIHKQEFEEPCDRRIHELMEAVSLDKSLTGRRPAELSGGQQQRVGIARGISLKPRLLIADEPVSALDVSVQAQILNLLADLPRRYGLTLIIISHSLWALHYLCTGITVMYQGRIVEEAPAVRFFENPLHPYSRILIDSMPSFNVHAQARSWSTSEEIPSAYRPPSGCAFHPRCPRMLPICRDQVPELAEVSPDQRVACFLY
jgi:oligopeptide/dipeptide ABC transporter ATP-binding protein